jgi:rare lipoprotein A (peptidoglycan hydrolase)
VALTLLGLLGPAGASASRTGGTSAPASEPPPPGSGAPSAEAEPPRGTTVTAPRTAFVRQRLRITGTARKARRKVVRIEQRRSGGAWALVARVRADRKGRFRAVWRPRRAGSYGLRARVAAASRTRSNGGTSVPLNVGANASGAAVYLTVYEPAIATWYGPGFWGRTTACGDVLTQETVGVAHRTLPCGTEVQIAYKRRTIVVPVIDRGPYANNADWDLTQAAAGELGMSGTSRIGAMPLSPPR